MSYTDRKITQAEINAHHVQGATDYLIGNPQQNKAVFDALPEFIAGKFNDLIDEIAGQHGDEIKVAVDEWLAEHPEVTTTVQDNSLTTAKYVDGSVTEPKIADGSVTPSKLDRAYSTTDDLASVNANLTNELNVLDARMDEFASLPEGSTTADAELMDIRVGADGETYQTAGGAVRGQVAALKSAIDPLVRIDKNSLIQGYFVDTSGERSAISSDYHYCTDYIYVHGLKKITIKTILSYSTIGFYKEDKTPLSHETGTYNVLTVYSVTVPENAYYVAIPFYNAGNVESNFDNFYSVFQTTFNDIEKKIDDVDAKCEDPLGGRTNYVTPKMTDFYSLDETGNLVFSEDVVVGSWISAGSGQMQTNQYTTSFSRTGYVEIEPNKNYTWLSGKNPYSFAVYDSSKNPISGSYGYAPIGTGYITTPANGKYLALCWDGLTTETNYAVIILGDSPVSKYTPPYYKLKDSPYVTKEYVDDNVSPNHVSLELPTKYELVVGDTFELFWNGVISAENYQMYFPDVVCDIGKNFKRKFTVTPIAGNVGTHTMTVTLYDQSRNQVDQKEVSLVVKGKATSPANEKVVLYVTDSLGENGYVPDEFNRRLTESGGNPSGDNLSNITFIGDSEGINRQTKYVGNGGWNWSSYNASMTSDQYMWITASSHGKTVSDQHSIYTDSNNKEWKLETIETNRIKIIRVSSTGTLPSTGTLTWKSGGENHGNLVYTASEQASGNPFWDQSQNKVSFSNFVEEQGESTLDYVYVLLGWNTTTLTESQLKTSVRTFINNVLADYSSCKIIILGIEAPSWDGMATNYGQNAGVLSSYQRARSHVFNLNKWYHEITQETDYNGKVSFVNISGQFDTEYNMPMTTVSVNTRNTQEISVAYNGVHPAQSGYYQIADACYRDFTHRLQD